MLVKICGITNQEDALHAVSCGATHIGVIFVPGTPRFVDVEVAASISTAIAPDAKLVGVFQNQDLTEVVQTANKAGLAFIQLHGEENAEYCTVLKQMLNLPIIKVVSLDLHPDNDLSKTVEPYQRLASQKIVDFLLFDKPKGLPKDLKTASHWLDDALVTVASLNAKCDLPPFFFAGGLNAYNLDSVPKSLGAAGFDVASGVEKSAGKKDPVLVQKFIEKIIGTKTK
jgi:phosphoribosylanthranilate isomerase